MTTALEPPSAGPFRPSSPEYLADPYGYLRQLRERGPVFVDPGTGMWFLLRFDDVEAGLASITRGHADGGIARSLPGQSLRRRRPRPHRPAAGHHADLQQSAVQRFRDRAQEIVDDGARRQGRGGGELRVVDEIGFPLPYHLTCDMLGVPEVDNVDELRDWTWKSLELIDAFLTPEQTRENLGPPAASPTTSAR